MRKRAARGSGKERGAALMAVILVLMALITIALPFALSMRSQDKSATIQVFREKSQVTARSALSLAEEMLAATDPDRDETPHYDSPEELAVRLGAGAERFGQPASDPRGTIWSAISADEQGKVNVNHASLHLLGNLLGGTRLAERLKPEEELEVRLAGAEGLPEQGVVWVDGELILYRSRSGRTLSGITRGFSTSVVASLPPGDHAAGAPVLDYRALLAAVYPWKIAPGTFRGCATVRALKDIARFGEAAFSADEIDGLEADLTVHSVLPGSERFLATARLVLAAGPGDEARELIVAGGASLGPGTVVRIRQEDAEEYNLVVAVDEAGGDLFRLVLQEPVEREYEADLALVDALARAPVNVNSCSRRVLVALMEGVRLRGSFEQVDRKEAELIAERVLEARPLAGPEAFAVLLAALREGDAISADDQTALLLNAENALCASLAVSTAPFVYRSYGVFTIDAAASENLPLGREQSRSFARVVSQVFPAGAALTLFASQLDFEEAIRLSRTGKYWATFPENVQDFDAFHEPPSRLRSALAGRHARQESEEPAYARLAPVRKEGLRVPSPEDPGLEPGQVEEAQLRVLHFDGTPLDETDTGSDRVDGYDMAARGPLALGVESDLLELLDGKGWPKPFCLEMWWQPGEESGTRESILFDSGYAGSEEHAELTNRIFASYDGAGGELVFRVADAAVPDPIGDEFPGQRDDLDPARFPAQIGHIRYAFDDGLEFDPTVPYHLSFYARGTKPSDLVLLVDGVPRGRRAFQTRLAEPLDPPGDAGPFANIPGYTAGQDFKIKVEDASLFPPWGIVRIGWELIEYLDRTDKELIVSRVAGDAFGGRARRGSRGQDHEESEESEAVELFGYAAVLLSEYVPHGNTGLKNALGEFGIAMVDPDADEASKSINVEFTETGGGAASLPVGTGIDSTVTSLPLVALGNPNASSSSTAASASLESLFDEDGGFALVVSCPRRPPSTGGNETVQMGDRQAQFSWTNVLRSTNGEIIGLGELIRYGGFANNTLMAVERAPGAAENAEWAGDTCNLLQVEDSAVDADKSATWAHAHVAEWALEPSESGYEQKQPIFVVPLSVKIGLGHEKVVQDYPVPRRGQQGLTRPEMVQIGTGFAGREEGGGTEWVRYDDIGAGCFVRDEPTRVRSVVDILARDLTVFFTKKNAGSSDMPTAAAIAKALNYEEIAGTQKDKNEIAQEAKLQSTRLDGGVLAFRGVLGTGAKRHPQEARVLPVFRTFRNESIYTARPGARDFVTLVDPLTHSQEEQRVNYGYCETDVEGWGAFACHLAFEVGVLGEYRSNFYDLFSRVDPDDPGAAMDALANQNIESRDLTRLLKFPSGELPSRIGENLYLGGDMYGAPSPGGGLLDEAEFFAPDTPSKVLPRHPRYVLGRDDKLEPDEPLYLRRDVLRYNLWDRGGPVIEAIDPVGNLPDDGFVLLIDDEFIAFSDVDMPDEGREAELTVAVNGRGFLGTPIQMHRGSAAARELTFLRVSRLEKSIGPDDHELVLKDAGDFPTRGGLVQIGRELLGYTRKEDNKLVMPLWRDPERRGDVGLLRGRFGTRPEAHVEGTLVLLFPARYEDRYRPRADDPELAYLGFFLKAKGGFYQELSWQAENASELADLVVEARVGGRGRFTEDPAQAPDVFFFEAAAGAPGPSNILRQGDSLELRVFTRFKEGAFDAAVFEPDPGAARGGSNEWKRAPRLRALGVEWLAAPARLAYEEWN
ncbi:MAG: hypothetical protein HY812_00870 [Planctomycetes bacterium]|nr:hypothetical protein [Planctomycetota bacterium]